MVETDVCVESGNVLIADVLCAASDVLLLMCLMVTMRLLLIYHERTAA